MAMYLEITLEFANIIIAIFAFVYGVLFLYHTVQHEHKKPWIFLTVGMLVFSVYQLATLLQNFVIETTFMKNLSLVLGTAFASLVLFSFVMQTDLILKFPYILIEKKGRSAQCRVTPKTSKKTSSRSSKKRKKR